MKEWTKEDVLDEIKKRAEDCEGKKQLSYDTFREIIYDPRFPQKYFDKFLKLVKILDASFSSGEEKTIHMKM